jgi:hypothetical protein
MAHLTRKLVELADASPYRIGEDVVDWLLRGVESGILSDGECRAAMYMFT